MENEWVKRLSKLSNFNFIASEHTMLTGVFSFNRCNLRRDRVEDTSFSGIIFATVNQILVSLIEFTKSFVVHICAHPYNGLTGRVKINRVKGFKEIDGLLGMKGICEVRDVEIKVRKLSENMKEVVFGKMKLNLTKLN